MLRLVLQASSKINSHAVPKSDEEAVWDGLQTLFHSEYVLLAEYIEVVLPISYAIYLSTLFHLPVAEFYPNTASLTTAKLRTTLASILHFAAVELVGFGVLIVLMRRKLGYSPLHHLAFVLETQSGTVQGYMFIWTLYILHLTLVHYGIVQFSEKILSYASFSDIFLLLFSPSGTMLPHVTPTLGLELDWLKTN